MKIGIISDSHDNVVKMRDALKNISNKGCNVLIHCGDFCSPFMIKDLSEFEGDVHCCFGNTDDRFTSTKLADKFGVNLHGDNGNIEADGKKIFFVHFPDVAEAFAFTGKYDAVFYGHSHEKKKDKVNDSWLVNPGEVLGMKGESSYAVYDTESNEVEIFSF